MARLALRALEPVDDSGYLLPDDDVVNLKLRKLRADARLAELTADEREGRLIARDMAIRTIQTIGADVAQRSNGIPDRIANEFGTDDIQRRRIRDRLRDEIAQVLRAFARPGGL